MTNNGNMEKSRSIYKHMCVSMEFHSIIIYIACIVFRWHIHVQFV